MKIIKYFLPVLILFFYSCGNTETTSSEKVQLSESEEDVGVLYGFNNAEIFVKDTNCRSDLKDCSHILIKYHEFTDIKFSNAKLRINHLIADMLGYGDAESTDLIDLRFAANNIITDYNDFKTEFPESSQIWHFRLKSRLTFHDSEKLSFLFVSESYMGGAHGSLNQVYLNFGTDGRILKKEDLIVDMALFKSIAEKKFRIKKNIKSGESYSSVGFDFPNDKFRLPANIGLANKNYILYYNSYEIAPYSSGPTQLVIGFDELK
jgi:hypothetical protein